MKTAVAVIVILFASALSGCSANSRAGAGVPTAAPQLGTSPGVAEAADQRITPRQSSLSGLVQLPDVIEIPATYRFQVINGKLCLVRETDARKIAAGGGVRLVAGDVSRNEFAVQPAILPQEVAAELTRNRAAHVEMIQSFSEAKRRMDQLLTEARTMQERNEQLVQRLAQVTDYAKQLEARLNSQQPMPQTQTPATPQQGKNQ